MKLATPRQLWEGFISLFYPHLCLACVEEQPPTGEIICLQCQYQLPKTNYHLERENPFTERFWGRIPLQSGAALYHFLKGGRTQQLLHQLKYGGKQEIGRIVGEWYGHELQKISWFQAIDVIVPVPLHPTKKRIRGYNQTDSFAEALSRILGKSWLPNGLRRVVHTQSQTTKSRIERFQNVIQAFEVNQPEILTGKHVLLVDDVLTTGATLEACATKILALPSTKVSMVTIAMTNN